MGNHPENLIVRHPQTGDGCKLLRRTTMGEKGFEYLSQFIKDFREWNLEKKKQSLPFGWVFQCPASIRSRGGVFNILQVFTLEVFPGLANYCAKRDAFLWLTMLRWKMMKAGSYCSLLVINECVFTGNI